MNREGIPTKRGRRWYPGTVGYVLDNPKYRGLVDYYFRWDGEEHILQDLHRLTSNLRALSLSHFGPTGITSCRLFGSYRICPATQCLPVAPCRKQSACNTGAANARVFRTFACLRHPACAGTPMRLSAAAFLEEMRQLFYTLRMMISTSPGFGFLSPYRAVCVFFL
jgi:hypothetical protein